MTQETEQQTLGRLCDRCNVKKQEIHQPDDEIYYASKEVSTEFFNIQPPTATAEMRERLEELVVVADRYISFELHITNKMYIASSNTVSLVHGLTRQDSLYRLLLKLCDEINGFDKKVKKVIEG